VSREQERAAKVGEEMAEGLLLKPRRKLLQEEGTAQWSPV
jgi:hypothetical protein